MQMVTKATRLLTAPKSAAALPAHCLPPRLQSTDVALQQHTADLSATSSVQDTSAAPAFTAYTPRMVQVDIRDDADFGEPHLTLCILQTMQAA